MTTLDKFAEEILVLAASRKDKTQVSRGKLQDAKQQLFGVEKRFIRVAVRKHTAILRQKFPEMDINELVDSVYLIFHDILKTVVPKRSNVNFFKNNNTDIIIGKNFRAIQDLMNEVKQEIRFRARKSIDESKRKVIQDELVATGIVLGGIDVRTQDQGGDLLKTDLKDGRIVKRKDLGKERAGALESINKSRGVQVGHAFGSGIGNVAAFTDTAEVFELFDPSEQLELQELRRIAVKIDARVTIEANLLKRTGKNIGSVTVLFVESTEGNTVEGAQLGRQVIARLKKIVNSKAEELALKVRASPTIIERYQNIITDMFLGKKLSKSDMIIGSRGRATKIIQESIPLYRPKLRTSKSKSASTRKKTNNRAADLQLLIGKLNSKLPDKIRENMGKGNSKQVLNYRTGRFAKSAKIKDITSSSEKNTLEAVVKYMRNPYGVFEPGGKLHKPGRDPHRLIGRSIRQILQEEKIANLRRVKVKLRG